jgi:hypothetical protein
MTNVRAAPRGMAGRRTVVEREAPISRRGALGDKDRKPRALRAAHDNETIKTFTFKLCYPLMTVHILYIRRGHHAKAFSRLGSLALFSSGPISVPAGTAVAAGHNRSAGIEFSGSDAVGRASSLMASGLQGRRAHCTGTPAEPPVRLGCPVPLGFPMDTPEVYDATSASNLWRPHDSRSHSRGRGRSTGGRVWRARRRDRNHPRND